MRLHTSFLALALVIPCSFACGDSGGGATASDTSTTTVTTATAPTSTTGDTATTDTPTSTGPTTGDATTTTTADSTTTTAEPPTTGSTTDATATTSTTTTTGESETDAVCDPQAVPDTLQFDYVKTIDIGMANIQASYYNIAAQELVFLSYMGPGKRVALDGTVLGDVAAPPEVTQLLDGATYDQVHETALLVDQACNFAEVDPVTLAPLMTTTLDAKFNLSVCSGLAIGLDGHLYITSTNTEEVVVITRDLTTEIRRFKVDDDGLGNVDGISLIAGSENFLVLSTFDLKAAIFAPNGDVVVPASTIGGVAPPFVGGDTPEVPDASLTVCGNGHAWICEGLQKVGCYEYAPQGGDSDSCPCVIPQ
ncbi:hypothetical protein [Nannocystis radixulma]|uniref:Uncharacterized protein n=1 Tax=Nannocystis radixulma TaxID=2995305 RepID=A0ABT5B3H2_9BACT|nr:hypothetical protein [Nannocystis radixulma]MDC0668664.1 hypothetical protein [Nannocystis radixulma]